MSTLFSPFQLRDVTFRNRIAVSPMSQYRAKDGHANAWHMVHLGRFALGGAGLVYAEATAVT
ncbi:MAG: NADH:flavin oxidoreductase/NADH oxidase, partial [Pseudomonadota bacterium]